MLHTKPCPIPNRTNFRLTIFLYCLSVFNTLGRCDAGSVIGSGLFHLAVSEDNLQSMRRTNDLNGTMSDLKMNSTNASAADTAVDDVGGGSVNEKIRQYRPKSRKHDSSSVSMSASSLNSDKNSETVYNPLNHRSHLLHALEGLHRYPNYLSRWNNGDVEILEQELQRVLQQVQEQKSKTHDQRDRVQLALRDFLLEHPEWKEFSAPPKTWDELREILDTRASDAVFRSPKIRKMTQKVAVDDVIDGNVQIE